jgi:hypothetical protein
MQTSVQSESTKAELEDTQREQDKLEAERKVGFSNELRDANLKLEVLKSDIKVAGDKLAYVGARKSEASRNGRGEVTITITRKGGAPSVADLDTDLRPGDVVEVELQIGSSRQASR